jgi:hypothetical protein
VLDPALIVLVSLCERALAGTLGLPELEEAWPEPVKDAALAPVREALEDAIMHTPGEMGTVNLRAWQQMPEYDDIEFYLRRLREAEAELR